LLYITPIHREVSVRGKRISRQARKLDVVVVAARYDEAGKRLSAAKGYERRGYVWGDVVLLDRQTLIDHLRSEKLIVTGRPAELEGDFEVIAPIRLEGAEKSIALVAEGLQAKGDDLGLPLF
jgi:hypothetical protein